MRVSTLWMTLGLTCMTVACGDDPVGGGGSLQDSGTPSAREDGGDDSKPDAGPSDPNPEPGKDGGSEPQNGEDAGTKPPDTKPQDPGKIYFLHHSIGGNILEGGVVDAYKALRSGDTLNEVMYPNDNCRGSWQNRPIDYHAFWINGVNDCTPNWDFNTAVKEAKMIIFKSCYTHDAFSDDSSPEVQAIDADGNRPNNAGVTSNNYISVYKKAMNGLKKKFKETPNTLFVFWTFPPKLNYSAQFPVERSIEFANWLRNEWDEPGDNIFLWDYRKLATDGTDRNFPTKYAQGDDHANITFARKVAPLFAKRIANIMDGKGDSTSLTGE